MASICSGAVTPEVDFSRLSEADVREEIIAPVVRQLGYQSGTINAVIREKQIELRYPFMFLGRKKNGRDPVLRGRPDYICEARNLSRWAIEAKAPSEAISRDDIEQAHSYAVHPELAAPLFVLCNGREWQVFESFRGPAAEPILKVSHEQLLGQPHLLENILSPRSLARRFPVHEIDLRKSLAPAFGSRVRIVGGFTRFDKVDNMLEGLPEEAAQTLNAPMQRLVGYSGAITGDTCFRDETSGIVADVSIHFSHAGLKEFATMLGLDRIRYVTRDLQISENPEKPSIFECSREFSIPAGQSVFDITRWESVCTPVPLKMVWHAEAIGHLEQNTFRGTYSSRMLSVPQHEPLPFRHWMFIRGSFEIELKPA